ncbi:cytochrome-c peroxidase [Massilia endophytica]|uniref:cytochrome-c peroxidase n=1 Tax=Massilia endophytica TaxID=2899220 RepID=UPI001E3AB17E|nr:cytochrome c peroxidase [Massilia endophytica]UGQ47990.1 tryptophan tryptophylquinone biosynthesis enzyme MauG [Massilia endophytica]
MMTVSLKSVALMGALALAGFSLVPSRGTTSAASVAPNPSAYQRWRLPSAPPAPRDNIPNADRVALGKMLFFDPRLSGTRSMACASCHNPMLGWSDGLGTARGQFGQTLPRSSPSIVNAAYNALLMWDGRKNTLEEQALAPLDSAVEMNADLEQVLRWFKRSPDYQQAFARAYPNEPIGRDTLGKAIASFERTVVSRNSPFDRWLAGEPGALTPQQLRGFALFMDRGRANCVACHAAPNFTDGGFHNVGLASGAHREADAGRYRIKPIAAMRGAFKTPALRDVEYTAPYFHDGSAATLQAVIEHYNAGGRSRANLAPEIKPLGLTRVEQADLVAFLLALSSPPRPFHLPQLPRE